MNKAILHGNVGNDPDFKRLDSGKQVAKFSLATNRSYTNQQGEKITETAWHNIILWNKLAELAEKYVKKGNSVIIEGEIAYRSYQNKEGQIVYITEIIADRLHFAGGKKDDRREAPEPEDKWQGKKEVGSMSDVKDLPGVGDDDDPLPF